MIRSWISSLRLATGRSTRMMAFEIARFLPKSQQNSYQGSIIWSRKKATLRKKIPGILHWQSSTFEGLSLPTTRTTQRNQQLYPSLSIQPHQWLDPPFHQWQGPWRLQWRNVVDLLSPTPPPLSKQKSPRPFSCLIFSDFPPRLPSRLEGFSPNILRIFRFSSSVSHWVKRFIIDWSRIFFIVPLGLGAWYLRIWFFFLTFLFVGRRFFYLFHKSNTKRRW